MWQCCVVFSMFTSYYTPPHSHTCRLHPQQRRTYINNNYKLEEEKRNGCVWENCVLRQPRAASDHFRLEFAGKLPLTTQGSVIRHACTNIGLLHCFCAARARKRESAPWSRSTTKEVSHFTTSYTPLYTSHRSSIVIFRAYLLYLFKTSNSCQTYYLGKFTLGASCNDTNN